MHYFSPPASGFDGTPPSQTACTDKGRGQPAKVELVCQCKMCRAYILPECITFPPASGLDGTPPARQRALTKAGGSRLTWILVWQCKMCRAYILQVCITFPSAGGFDGGFREAIHGELRGSADAQ